MASSTPNARNRAERRQNEIPTGPRAAYTINQTCDLLGGCSRDWVYARIRSGEIRSLKLGSRRFIPASEIERIAAGAS